MEFLIMDVVDESLELRLTGDQARRLRKVLRLSEGSPVMVLDSVRPRRGIGRLSQGDRLVNVQWEDLASDPHPDLVLVACPLKGDRTERAARALFELGLRGLVLTQTERSQFAPPPRLLRRLEATAVAACEQSGRLHLPSVSVAAEWPQALAQASQGRMLLLHPGGAPMPGTLNGPVTLFVGPEGGFGPRDLSSAEAAGAERIRLPGHVLRAETAMVSAAALALAAFGFAGVGAAPRP